MSPDPTPATDRQLLDALARGVALADRSDRHRLDVSGPDRASLLHNLTTNDVRRLAEGRGCEAFVTTPRGRTLAFVTLLARPDRILVRTDAGGLVPVIPHLRKYGALEDVTLDDATSRTFEFHLSGPRAGELLGRLGAEVPPEGDLTHHATLLGGKTVLVVRESPTVDPGFTVVGESADAAEVARDLAESGGELGLARMSPEQFEALRIEAGTPASGRDLDESNLPQELDRDRRAISFVKGCYLGQETVARLDALGHVNKILRCLAFDDSEPPPVGASLLDGEKVVGIITSSACSLRDGRAIALAYVHSALAEPGTVLACRVGVGDIAARVLNRPLRDRI